MKVNESDAIGSVQLYTQSMKERMNDNTTITCVKAMVSNDIP